MTNAYSRSQKCLVSVYHLAPQISEAFSVFMLLGANAKIMQQLLIHLDCLCFVSLPISVFFTHSLHVILRKGQGTISKRRGLITYVQTTTSTANFWAQIIFDPYRRPLTLTFLRVSTRGLFQDTMFDRQHYSTLSEDTSEVLVQPLTAAHKNNITMFRINIL